jgi:hypothetical protein
VITVPNGKFDELATWLESHPASDGGPPVVQFNHPSLHSSSKEYGADDFANEAEWLTRLGKFVSLIEVLNGPALERTDGHEPAETMESDFLSYLNRGFKLAPTGDQDNHYFTWGTITNARTAVIAPSLTSNDLLAALRARRVYATEDPNLEIIFQVNGVMQGGIVTTLPAVNAELDIRYTILDSDEELAEYQIEVFSDDGPGGPPAMQVDVFDATGNTSGGQMNTLTGVRFRGAGQYVWFKITQTGEDGDDDRVWTAPVWFEVGPPTPPSPPVPPATAQLRIASLLPNPVGDELEDEEVTIRNAGTTAVNVAGWTLRDPTGRTWSLTSLGSIPAGATRTIRRLGQPMALNNGGDTVMLVAPNGGIIHQITYQTIAEGQTHVVPP